MWPGDISPELALNAVLGGIPLPPYGLPPPSDIDAYARTAVDLGAPEPLWSCCRVIRVTHTSAMPAWIAAAASPSAPAQPPPPEVRPAVKRTSGTPSTERDLGRVARERVDREPVEVVDREAGVVERSEDRRAHIDSSVSGYDCPRL